MAKHVDHVEPIFGIDAELSGGSNGEDLSKKLEPSCGQNLQQVAGMREDEIREEQAGKTTN
jgi:hypothetical protein